MQVYKVVVRQTDGTLWSVRSVSSVQYIPGRPTRPRPGDGPLCAFDALDRARQFVWHVGEGEIWIAQAIPSRTRWIWCCDPSEAPSGRKWRRLEYLPSGTMLCQTITLIQKVPHNGTREMLVITDRDTRSRDLLNLPRHAGVCRGRNATPRDYDQSRPLIP